MFDGAALAVVDPLALKTVEASAPSASSVRVAWSESQDASAAAARPVSVAATVVAPREVVFIDASVPDPDRLIAGLRAGVEVVMLDPAGDGLAQIASVAAGGAGDVAALHLVSHGAEGRVTLGNRVLDVASLQGYRAVLDGIGRGLTADADVLLYGCDIGSGAQGEAFLRAIAAATGADVAASVDPTGAATLGGNWTLESSVGGIEASVALRAESSPGWQHVLSETPGVALSMGSPNVLLGETFTIEATFDNVGYETGYGPYIDLFVPATGADGGAAPDGITVTGASYLGRGLTVTQIVLSQADIDAGTVAHPYARDDGGGNRVSIPGGFGAGDRLVVIELPFGSYGIDQPPAQIAIEAVLSPLADVGTPLEVVARSGFRYGTDPLDNPDTDPSSQSSTVALSIEPSLYRMTTRYLGPEDETATGPNYQRGYRIDVDIAAGQTLSSIDLSAALDAGMQFSPIAGVPSSIGGTPIGAALPGGWTNASGVLVSTAASGAPGPDAPGGTVARTVTSVTGTSGAIDLSMVFAFHVPEFDASSSAVLDPATGGSASLELGTGLTGSWTPLDPRDASAIVVHDDAVAHRLEVDALAIQKTRVIADDVRAQGLSPADVLRYTLDVQVSDYFAIGGSIAAGTPLNIVDTLSDGLLMVDATIGPFADPVLTIARSGSAAEVVALTRGIHYTVTSQSDGREVVTFDLRTALQGAAGPVLIGDLFGDDATRDGATTLRLTFSAQVLEQYRVAPPNAAGAPVVGSTQLDLNEADRLVNNAVVTGTVLDAALDPARPGQMLASETTRVSDQLASSTVAIAVSGRNGLDLPIDASEPARIAVGDTVSYVLTYTIPTGDVEQFGLTAYLPLPIFDITDPDSDGTPNGFVQSVGPYDATPPSGRFSFEVIGGNGLGTTAPAVSTIPTANGLQFFFGDRVDATDTPVTVRVAFTVTAADSAFVDGLFLTAQAQADGTSTALEPIVSQSIALLQVSAPNLSLHKGVVQDDVDVATSVFDPVFSTGVSESLVRPAGDAGADPRLATLGDAQVSGLDSNVAQVDSGDALRFAIVVQNLGDAARGAFDVTLLDQLPAGVDPASITNLRLTLGDGTPVYDGSPGSLANLRRGDGSPIATQAEAIAALFGTSGLQLVDGVGNDGVAGTADDLGALGGRRDASGAATAPGSNVLIVTYDARLQSGVEAGATLSSAATLARFAATEGGTDLATTDPTDAASIVVALPSVDKVIVGTSEPAGTTAGLDVVIGERITYEVTLTMPEGTLTAAEFVDTLDPGLSFVSIDSISASAGVSFDGGLPLPSAVFPVSAGGDANRVTVPLGTITNSNRDNAVPETITVRYTAVVSNVAANQQGRLLDNAAQFISSQASVSRDAPDLRVVEPSLSVTLVPTVTRPDAGDLVGHVLTITAPVGGPPAFDLDLDVASLTPAGLSYEPGSLQVVSAPVGGTAAFGGDGIVGSWARLDAGQQIVLRFDARVTDTAAFGDTFGQTASVRFTSLPGTGNGALSPFTAVGDAERTGTATDPGGTLNDYRASASASVSVDAQAPVLTLVASSEPLSAGATVVPGEVVRFRMVVQVPEGSAAAARIAPTLPAGLRFVNDGSATVAFVATGGGTGIDSSTLTGAVYDLAGGGADAPAIAGLTPIRTLPGAAIVDALDVAIPAGTVMAAGDAPRFVLGDLANADRDTDKEFVVVEFNAIVDNATAGSAGATGDVRFDWRTDGASRALSNIVGVTVGEPSIIDLDKRVVAVSGSQVTFETTFTNTGSQAAHDVRLVDGFAGAVNLVFAGAGSVTGIPAGGSNASDVNGLDVRLPVLAAGASASIRYVATVTDPGQTVPARDAVVTYTSLSAGGVSLTTATSAGAVVTPTTGERTGDAADYGAAVNVYRDADPAALGTLSGRLWDDTSVPDGVIGVGEARLAGVLVTLTHAGADGTFGSGDDLSFSSTTDASGAYTFGAVPEGAVRISAPTVIANANGTLGEVRARVDVQGSPTDARIALTVVEGLAYADLDIGYVQRNDAPTIAVPGPQTVDEAVSTPIAGVTVADPDGTASTAHRVVLSVGTGTLVVVPAGGVVASGVGSQTVVLAGPVADLNATLATLVYRSATNPGPSDTLVIRVDDGGNAGDADGDGLPGEPLDDNLSAQRTVPIILVGINDAPVARPDARTLTEDQRITDGAAVAGNATGDVADTDIDGDVRSVAGVVAGTATGPLSGGVGRPIVTPLGVLTLQADGAYTYQPSVDLQAGRSVQDVFSYTVADPSGATSTTTITITITGADDPPVAVPDANRVRAGGVGTTSGNVVAAGAPTDSPDFDPDTGDVLAVRGVVAGPTGGPIASGAGTPVQGVHGTVVIGADGRYTYRLDAADPAVVALRPGQTLTDLFSYTISDAAGATATTTLTITIEGNEPPTAGSSTQVLDQDRLPGAPPPSAGPPVVTDPDTPTQDLTVRIDAIVRPEAGAFVRPGGTPVSTGDALSVPDLQTLLFVPSPGFVGTPSADGTVPGSSLAFTVTDPSGNSAPGSISIAVRPLAPLPMTGSPAPGPLAASSTLPLLSLVSGGAPPGVSGSPVTDTVRALAGGPMSSEAAMLQPYALGPLAAPLALDAVPGEYVRQAVTEARDAMHADRMRLDADAGRLDLDAGGLFPSNRVDGLFGEERIGPTRDWTPLLASVRPPAAAAAAEPAPAPAIAGATERVLGPEDDCEPPPKPKPKPVKRILPESLVRPAPSFSEQLDVQKKKFRAPASVVPKAPPPRQC
jgi:fimbrial isopeptide formation D2 family protein/uncharacterized repeat protein (TIGR01451 family)